jgi:hypothetical protein
MLGSSLSLYFAGPCQAAVCHQKQQGCLGNGFDGRVNLAFDPLLLALLLILLRSFRSSGAIHECFIRFVVKRGLGNDSKSIWLRGWGKLMLQRFF